MGQCLAKSKSTLPDRKKGSHNNPNKHADNMGSGLSTPASLAERFGIKQSSPWRAYERLGELGEGGFSKIYRARHRQTGKTVAVKMLDKLRKHSRDTFLVEVKLLLAINHENVVTIHEMFEDKHAYYIIIDLLGGKDLFEVLDTKRDVFPETTAADLVRRMAEAVRYCHSKNIVHLDLKPENFVFANADNIRHLVLVDFGLGRLVADDAFYRDRVGSMQYIAPEMIDESSVCSGLMLKACDMWSMGVILYILVTGLIPFSNWDEVKVGRLRLSRSMSKELRDLLKNLLTRDTVKRLTAEQVLNHPFLTNSSIEKNPMFQAVGAGARYLSSQPRMSQLLLSVADHMYETVEIEDKHELDALFYEFDVDRDGHLNDLEMDTFAKRLEVDGAGDVFADIAGKSDGGLDRSRLIWIATIGMLQLKTGSTRKRMAFAFGQRKAKLYVSRQEFIRANLKGITSKAISDLFINASIQDRRSVLLFDDVADALFA